MLQAQNRETINSTWKVSVSFKIITTTSVTRPCFTTQHQTCKTKTTVCNTKTKTDFFGLKPGLVLRPTVSDHFTVWDRRCLCCYGDWFLQWLDTVGWVVERASGVQNIECWYAIGGDPTGDLHVLIFRLVLCHVRHLSLQQNPEWLTFWYQLSGWAWILATRVVVTM